MSVAGVRGLEMRCHTRHRLDTPLRTQQHFLRVRATVLHGTPQSREELELARAANQVHAQPSASITNCTYRCTAKCTRSAWPSWGTQTGSLTLLQA